MAKVYVGAKHVKFVVSTGIDLSYAVLLKLYIKKPNGAEATWTATVSGDAEDGVVYYYSVAGDLDIEGTYLGMAYVTTATDILWGETFSFRIYPKYK